MHHHPTAQRRVTRALGAGCCAATIALALAPAAPAATKSAPVVRVQGGAVRGTVVNGTKQFLGLPYAAPPSGRLRWRPPQPASPWRGIREANSFASACVQSMPGTGVIGAEDCLYLNVYTPGANAQRAGGHPVLVWIHGGGLSSDQAANYDPSELAADGTVVVTINYRLGALGFLAHPALARHHGGPTGNYGLMDQQAALRWVQRNIRRFGGDPRNVTIAGQSAGGLSVLAQLASRGARGLFHRAIVQSGAFALKQQPLPIAEAAGRTFAAKAGCPGQSAGCLRRLPAADLVANQGLTAIPSVVDGKVLKMSVGTALAGGRFNRVPILNASNREEERVFLSLNLSISGGKSVNLPEPITAESYQRVIATTFDVSAAAAARIAAAYPPAAFPGPELAFSALNSDANFACPALQVDRWTSRYAPTYGYEFNDETAPEINVPRGPLPTTATHSSELQYLFGLPNAPFPAALNPGQKTLRSAMQHAWARFAASGAPTNGSWPAFDEHRRRMLSLVLPAPRVQTDFAARHHCEFWARLP